MNAGSTWPAVLSCIQDLSRSLPSAKWEAEESEGEGEGGASGAVTTLREKVPTPDPLQYPGYEPPLEAAQARLRQRRRAEDAVGDAQVNPLVPFFIIDGAFLGGVREGTLV